MTATPLVQCFRCKLDLVNLSSFIQLNLFKSYSSKFELAEKNLQHASIVESVLPYDSRNMYVCEEERDIDLIMKEMIERDKISVPLRKMARSTESQPRESLGVDPNSFKQYVKNVDNYHKVSVLQ